MTARFPVVFAKRAEKQIDQANEWWRINREDAPNAVGEELASAIELIALQPGVGVLARTRRSIGVRRVLLPRIGYFLYYCLRPRLGCVEVLAFWHARRGSNPNP